MTTAWSAILDDMLEEHPGLGLKLTVNTSSSAATVTCVSPMLSRYANETTFFNPGYVYIPGAAAADDQVRSILRHEVSTATTTIHFHDTSNYAETLPNEPGYILGVHPDTIMAATNKGLRDTKVRVEVPLMHGPASGDMQGSSVDADWTESGAADTVQTTAAEVLRGAQSLVVADSGSGGGYTASAAQRVGQGQSITVFGEAKADTGTGKVQIMDGSSNEQGSITFTEEQWVAFKKRIDFDTADELFTLRLGAVAASDSIDYQRVWFVRHGEYSFILPSWISNDFVVAALVRRPYSLRSNDSGSSDELWLAESNDDELLYEGHHYKAYKRPADVNPRRITLLEPAHRYMDDPLIVFVDCPWSAPYGVSATYTSYTSTTLMPKKLAVGLTLKNLGKGQGWETVEETGEEVYDDAYVMNELEEQTKPKPAPWRGPMGGLVI